MSIWSRPKVKPPVLPFTPANRPFLKGITAGYHEGLPPPYQMKVLNGCGVPILLRYPCVTREQAEAMLEYTVGYQNLKVLLLIENITGPLTWTIDHYKLWGVQLGNETDIQPYNWTPQQF